MSIRDQCRRALKNKRAKGKTWKYEKNITFLVPFFKERDRISGEVAAFEQMFLNETSFNPMDSFDATNDNKYLPEAEEQPKTKRLKIDEMLEASSTMSPGSNSSHHPQIKTEEEEFESSTPEQKLIPEQSVKGPYIAIDSFFEAMAATVKQFSPYNQLMAKSKIFAVVSELELQQIQVQSSNQAITSSAVALPSESLDSE